MIYKEMSFAFTWRSKFIVVEFLVFFEAFYIDLSGSVMTSSANPSNLKHYDAFVMFKLCLQYYLHSEVENITIVDI
jgi:hypothetical protein